MMRMAEIQFGEWLPDTPDYKNPGCVVADGCYPSPGGYGPFLGPQPQGHAVNEKVQGAGHFSRSDGSWVTVGGTSTKLFVIAGGSLTETTGYTAIGPEAYWQFARFNDYIVAVAPNNAPQYLSDIDTATTWAALPGSPPQAKVVGRVGHFLVLGNLSGIGRPNAIQWSAENDPLDWPTPGTRDARLKQSGRAYLQPEYGAVTAIAGDRYPLVFQERAITRLDPVGPPTVFQATTISEERGAIAAGAVVTVGFVTYFLAHDGFWATNGADIVPIGSKRINKWFFDEASQVDVHRTHGIVDWERQCIVWAFYMESNPDTFRKLLIYSWQENRWSTATLTVDYLVEGNVPATTLEGLDALFPSGIESVSPDLDSQTWAARGAVLAAFMQNANGQSELNLLNGATLAAAWETGDAEPEPGLRVGAVGIYPLIENADRNTSALLGRRDAKGGPITWSAAGVVNGAGFCPVRGEGRFVRARVEIPAGSSWKKAQGVQVRYRIAGRR